MPHGGGRNTVGIKEGKTPEKKVITNVYGRKRICDRSNAEIACDAACCYIWELRQKTWQDLDLMR